jgi:hypothetical protein
MLEITQQRGEWWEVGATITNPITKQPRDISGKAVDVVVRRGPKEADPLVDVTGKVAAILDGPTGEAMAGGRCATPGNYYGTVIVGTEADGTGWPAKEPFKLTIKDCP